MLRTNTYKALMSAATLAVACSMAAATITGRGGAVAYSGQNGPGFSAVPDGAGTHPTTIFAWDEKQSAVLTADVVSDYGNTVEAGTPVSSHMLRYNRTPAGPEAWFDPTIQEVIVGDVTFDGIIIAVLGRQHSLDATDYLGSSGTEYPNHPSTPLRGFDPDHDFYRLSGPNQVTVRIHPSDAGDELRVLTRGSAIPEPATLSLLALGVLPLLKRRRR